MLETATRAPASPQDAAAPAQSQLTYFFEARVVMKRETWFEFERRYGNRGGRQVVELLEAQNIWLRHSALYEAEPDQYTFYNFWELGPDANKLAQVELALADKVLWAEFIRLDRIEDKDFSYLLTPERQLEVPAGFNMRTARYLRIEYDLVPAGNAEMRARLQADLRRTGKKLRWMGGDSYLLHSGLEGRLVQMWLVPGYVTQQEADDLVEELPWCVKPFRGGNLIKDVSCAVLARSDFDPER